MSDIYETGSWLYSAHFWTRVINECQSLPQPSSRESSFDSEKHRCKDARILELQDVMDSLAAVLRRIPLGFSPTKARRI